VVRFGDMEQGEQELRPCILMRVGLPRVVDPKNTSLPVYCQVFLSSKLSLENLQVARNLALKRQRQGIQIEEERERRNRELGGNQGAEFVLILRRNEMKPLGAICESGMFDSSQGGV